MKKKIGLLIALGMVCMVSACSDGSAGNTDIEDKDEVVTDSEGNIIEGDESGEDKEEEKTYKEVITVSNKALWDAWTPSYEVKDGETIEFNVQLTGGPEVYHSLNLAVCNIPTDGVTFPANMAGYYEYVILRSDEAGWGDHYGRATYTGSDRIFTGFDVDYATVWSEAEYDIKISRNGNTLIYDYVIEAGDGVTYNCGWEVDLPNLDKGLFVYFTGDAGVEFTLRTNETAAYKTVVKEPGGMKENSDGSYTVKNSEWWDAWTPSYKLSDGDKLYFTVELDGGNTTFHSLNAAFSNVLTDGKKNPLETPGYYEYVLLRSDQFGWGPLYESVYHTNKDYIFEESYTPSDYESFWNGAIYSILVSRDGDYIRYIYNIEGGNGVVKHCSYEIPLYEAGDGKECYVFFTGDAGVTFTLKKVDYIDGLESQIGGNDGGNEPDDDVPGPDDGMKEELSAAAKIVLEEYAQANWGGDYSFLVMLFTDYDGDGTAEFIIAESMADGTLPGKVYKYVNGSYTYMSDLYNALANYYKSSDGKIYALQTWDCTVNENEDYIFSLYLTNVNDNTSKMVGSVIYGNETVYYSLNNEEMTEDELDNMVKNEIGGGEKLDIPLEYGQIDSDDIQGELSNIYEDYLTSIGY